MHNFLVEYPILLSVIIISNDNNICFNTRYTFNYQKNYDLRKSFYRLRSTVRFTSPVFILNSAAHFLLFGNLYFRMVLLITFVKLCASSPAAAPVLVKFDLRLLIL